MKLVRAILLFGLLVLFLGCFQGTTIKSDKDLPDMKESPLMPFTKKILPNGLTVFVKEIHTSPIAAVHFWCRTGVVNENGFPIGISHFFEHMFFKGTEKMGAGEMDRIVKSLGGYNNAFTSKEFTGYYIVVPSENYTVAFDILLDAIRNSIFEPEEVDRERNVIYEEINRSEDLPERKAITSLYKLLFSGTPYSWPILGTKESLSPLKSSDFKRYLKEFYVPNNITVAIVGDVNTQEILGYVENATADWKKDPSVKNRLPKIIFTPQDTIRTMELKRDINLVYWFIGFPINGYQDTDETFTLDVVTSILGEGRSSRFYRRLIQNEGLVSSVSCHISPMRMGGAILISTVFPPENEEKVRNIIFEEVKNIKEGDFTDDEMNRAKTMLSVDYAFDNETGSDIAQSFGYFSTVGEMDKVLEYEKRIAEVSREGIVEYSRKAFRFDAYSEVVIRPDGKEQNTGNK